VDIMNKGALKAYADPGTLAVQPRQPNLTEQLEGRLEYHEAEAAKLKEAIAAVKSNPELEHILNLLQRL
jgi:hypothetical protein